MSLKIRLRPGEPVLIGGVLMTNGDKRQIVQFHALPGTEERTQIIRGPAAEAALKAVEEAKGKDTTLTTENAA